MSYLYRRLLFAIALIASGAAIVSAADAARFSTLYSFCAQTNCADGKNPISKLLIDSSGNLYGETYSGGKSGFGTVFMLERDTANPTYKVLYSFCPNKKCGQHPYDVSGLIMDNAGNLYGTTSGGGGQNAGTAFELMTNADHTKWKFKLLYTFCPKLNCEDGYEPMGGLTYVGASAGAPYDGTSPLYGMTVAGGATNNGTVFSLTPSLSKKKFDHAIVYNFCHKGPCIDGQSPEGGLVAASDDKIYGVTKRGGADYSGVLFDLTRSGDHWRQRTLHTFCQDSCADGEFPSDLMLDPESGVLFGTTPQLRSGDGTLFSFDPGNKNFAIAHAFCPSGPCTDGGFPAGVTLNRSGVLYGSTSAGGDYDWGTVFSINEDGSRERVLYSFCADSQNSNCPDGREPYPATVTVDSHNHVFGTTNSGGVNSSAGTIFELTP